MSLDLVDRIYECAFVPDLWPRVLDEIGLLIQARGGVLLTTNGAGGVLRWLASEALQETVGEFVAGGWLMKSGRLGFVVAPPYAGFGSPRATTAEEFTSDVANRDFFLPRGFGWPAGTIISIPTGDRLVISLERDIERGPVEPETFRTLDELRPHLARSGLLSARLQMERARAVSDALATIGLPAIVLDNQRMALAVNPLAEALTEHIRWRTKNRLSLKDPIAEVLFRQAMEMLGIRSGAQVSSFPVRGSETIPALVAHVIPISGSARDLVMRCAAILVLTPVTMQDAPPVELIQSLFDLTAAEARVARSLASGDSVDEIAAVNSVSINTVRTHVRGVLEKTGCRRQSEVVALLGGISVGHRR